MCFLRYASCVISWLTKYTVSYRRNNLEKKLADADVSEEEHNNILKHLEKEETECMRLQRHKMGVDDFELLTMIGKGAFGEVYFIVCVDYMRLNHAY